MEKVRPWCGRPSDQGRLKNRLLSAVYTDTQTIRCSNRPHLCMYRIISCSCAVVTWSCAGGLKPVLRESSGMVGVLEVNGIGVNPAPYLIMQPTVNQPNNQAGKAV